MLGLINFSGVVTYKNPGNSISGKAGRAWRAGPNKHNINNLQR